MGLGLVDRGGARASGIGVGLGLVDRGGARASG